ncbi:hypothetical protein I8755_22905 [Streptomyces alfalfae]|uniref:Lipoprotein n=1 Tax=Streptomyces alfalfae TaxID=1642299 RepID=A0A7T4PIK2_9ACTN|nr:hypothetical protein I8755_22905 [Streptomyces alfalfae]
MRTEGEKNVKSTVSRAVVTATVTVALGLTAACGGGGDSDDSGDGKKPSKSATSAQPKEEPKPEPKEKAALSSAELEKAVLASGDLKGYKVEKLSAEDMPELTVPVKPRACQALGDMFMFTSDPRAAARVGRSMTGPDELDATVISFALLAHKEGAAKNVMDDLRTATEKCESYEDVGSKFGEVAPLTAPKLGDDAISYKLVGLIDDQKTPMSFTVVRSDSTLVAFYSINLLKPKAFGVPEKVVKAQVTKLEKQ